VRGRWLQVLHHKHLVGADLAHNLGDGEGSEILLK
jgi:hypothetical protein